MITDAFGWVSFHDVLQGGSFASKMAPSAHVKLHRLFLQAATKFTQAVHYGGEVQC